MEKPRGVTKRTNAAGMLTATWLREIHGIGASRASLAGRRGRSWRHRPIELVME